MEAMDKAEMLALDACTQGAHLLHQGKLSKSQAVRVAVYAGLYSFEASKMAIELLDPAWAAVSMAWSKASAEWFAISKGLC